MRVTPPIITTNSPIPDSHGHIPPTKVLHTEDGWELLDAKSGRYNTGRERGWQSVIKHYCANINGSPYWMLLEYHDAPTLCKYCKEEMPPGIVALFKFHNMEAMR